MILSHVKKPQLLSIQYTPTLCEAITTREKYIVDLRHHLSNKNFAILSICRSHNNISWHTYHGWPCWQVLRRVLAIPCDGACLSYLLAHNNTWNNLTGARNAGYYWSPHVKELGDTWGRSIFYEATICHEMSKRPARSQEWNRSPTDKTYGASCQLRAAREIFLHEFQVYCDDKLISRYGDDVWAIKTSLVYGNLLRWPLWYFGLFALASERLLAFQRLQYPLSIIICLLLY